MFAGSGPLFLKFWRSANLGAHHGTCHKGLLVQHVRALTTTMHSRVLHVQSRVLHTMFICPNKALRHDRMLFNKYLAIAFKQ